MALKGNLLQAVNTSKKRFWSLLKFCLGIYQIRRLHILELEKYQFLQDLLGGTELTWLKMYKLNKQMD